MLGCDVTGLCHALQHIEMPLVQVLAEMEETGIGFDTKVVEHQLKPLKVSVKSAVLFVA